MMKNSTKIILVGIAAFGIVWFIRSKRKTPIVKKNPNANQNVADNPPSAPTPENPGSAGSTTNAGTTLTTDLNPIINLIFSDDDNLASGGGASTSTQSNPCAPKEGFTITTYTSGPNTNITRLKQMCEDSSARWVSTKNGGCCIKKNNQISIINPPPISSPIVYTPIFSPIEYNNNCFISDTDITLSDGEKIKIKDVKVGDEVLSWNEETKNQEISTVIKTIESTTNTLISIETDSGIKLTCTKEHPFWVERSSGWIQAMLLESGDVLNLEDGKSETIVNIESNKVAETPVYNLHISDNHTYYANSVLVHNKDVEANVTYTGTAAQEIVQALQNIFEDQYYSESYT
jgi:hypothetical protein